MNQRNSFYRKIAYGAGMAALLFPLALLSSPETKRTQGGKLAKLRTEHKLGQGDLGEIDPASETMKLATLGLRGVAVSRLWNQANEYKKTENWSKLTATLDQLAKLQPNFITFWKYQSWNQSYNLSVEFDDYRDRYYYVRRGIEFLEEGQKYNRENPQLLWELGWFVGQKIGRADERVQYRRLFKADDEYHAARDRPVGTRDNWQVSKDWFLDSVEAASEKGYGRKSPIVFFSSAAKSQMNYAEAIEEDGFFEIAESAWATAESEWRDFGALEIEHSQGGLLRLGSQAQLEEQLENISKQLQDLAPEAYEQVVAEAEKSLTDEERAVRAKPAAKRDEPEMILFEQSEQKLVRTPNQIAEGIGKIKPELRRQALQIAGKTSQVGEELRKTRAYKQTANYDYWLTRCEFEQTEQAVQARQLIYRGKKAFTEDLDPIKAKALYKEGLDRWREVLDAYPVLLEGEGTTGADIFVYVRQYAEILEQLDEELPDEFPLWEIVEKFDDDRQLVDALSAYRARQREKEQKGEAKKPASDADADADAKPGEAGKAEEAAAEPEPEPQATDKLDAPSADATATPEAEQPAEPGELAESGGLAESGALAEPSEQAGE